MALFEGYERRMPQLQPVLEKYGFKDFDELKAYNNSKGVDAYKIVEGIQPICFENAKWAYELGAAIALKKGVKTAAEAAAVHRRRPAGLLHPRLRCRPAPGRPGSRQSGRDAAQREDRVLRLPGRPRVLRCRRGRHRYRPQRQQGAQDAPARYPERPGQGRRA